MSSSSSDDKARAPELSPAERHAREAFVAHKRHDLLTPINAIIGYSEMLMEDARDADRNALAADLERIHHAGKVLLVKVKETLHPSRLHAGSMLEDMQELAAQVRHEMREDINTVSGYSEMLIEDLGDDDDNEEIIDDLRKIHSSSGKLLDLIGDIVNFSSVISGQEPLHSGDAGNAAMIQGIAETLTTLESERRGDGELPGHVLVVDDVEMNRDMLARRLERDGHTYRLATHGQEALDWLEKEPFDAILLDILMPVMDGYQVLQRLKQDARLRHTPVIMLSALDQLDSVVRCIEMGADDFLAKPFNPTLLQARLGACLEKKRLRDREREYLEEIQAEREKSEQLLLNILPRPVADRLKSGEPTIADAFGEVTVLFSDFVGFTNISAGISAKELVGRLNDIFRAFDDLTDRCGVEKIKTIGDAYMVVAGVPVACNDHAERMARMALGMLEAIDTFNRGVPQPFGIRIGINTGPVVAGVIGTHKFAYDLWGDAVNTASRMESHGVPGRIQVSPSTYERLRASYDFEERGDVEVKGKGRMKTYLLLGEKQRTT